jgi:hypothetical protein
MKLQRDVLAVAISKSVSKKLATPGTRFRPPIGRCKRPRGAGSTPPQVTCVRRTTSIQNAVSSWLTHQKKEPAESQAQSEEIVGSLGALEARL